MMFVPFVILLLTKHSLAEAPLKPNDILAICGDSITQQQLYSVYIQDYLLMCQPVENVRTMQFGWSGERAEGFLIRMQNDVLRFKPSIATTFYGMNDGGYAAYTSQVGDQYREYLHKIVETFVAKNVRVVVGSPGCVDSFTYNRDGVYAEEYNRTLASLRDIAKEVAHQNHCAFADVYQVMYDVMQKAKAKYGQEYPVAGGDGVHPDPNGHLIIAYAFLKALGISGEIGTIHVDLAAHQAAASEGHSIKSFDNDIVTIQSTRYPFCFLPDPKNPVDPSSPQSTRSMIEFLPFNQDLNRFMLLVSGGQSPLMITWGEQSKQFSADELSNGVNLAEEFLDNPFVESFQKVDTAVKDQQSFEMLMVKSLVHNIPQYKLLPDQIACMESLINASIRKQQSLFDTAVNSLTPVTHAIRLEAVK